MNIVIGTTVDAGAEGGLVRLATHASLSGHQVLTFLSPEEARSLALDLNEAADVAELSESEAKAEREADEAES